MNTDAIYSEILWGVAVWRLAAAALLILLGFAARRLILWLFQSVLMRQAAKTSAQWDDELIKFIPAPLAVIAQILIWFLASNLLLLPKEPVTIDVYVSQGLTVALWVAVTWLGFRLVDVLTGTLARLASRTESKLDDQLLPMLRKTLKIVIGTVVAIMVLQNLGYSVTSLVASLGVGGLALALAAKDTVANLFGSVVVFTDRPFQIGDWVEVAGIEGTVEEVGFRTTRVRRFDQSLVTVPNATFSSHPIINHSVRPIRRIFMTVGVTYETSAAQMRELLDGARQLITAHPGIDQGFHFVHFTGFGSSSLELQIYCFTKSTVWTEFLTVREELMLQIMDLVESKRLEMAFPTTTVYLRDEQWPQRKGAPASG